MAAIIAGAVLLTAVAYATACAEGGKIRFGNLALIPSFGLEEEYNDNIYYDKSNTKSDWITHIQPGLLLDYTLPGRGKVKLGYGGDYAYYAKNGDNDWKHHTGLFDLNYEAPVGLIVKINNVFERSEDPFGSENEYKLGTKTKRLFDGLTSAFGFKFSERLKLFTFYNFRIRSYDSKEDFDQNYYSNEVGAGAEAKVSHKTWTFLRYHYGERNYYSYRSGVTSSNDADYSWHRLSTGLTWEDGGHFGGEINFGYQLNSFKNKYDMNGNRYKDKNSWTAATAFHYRQTLARTFSFKIERGPQQDESGKNGYFMETTLGFSVSQRIQSAYEVAGGYEFTKRDFSGSGSNSDGQGEKSNTHRVHASFCYFIKEWMTASVHYQYENKTADTSADGYKANRIMFNLNIIPASYH
jgi:hypothetical protein